MGCPADLFHGDHITAIVHSGSAVFFIDWQAQISKFAQLIEGLFGELSFPVHLLSPGGDFVGGELSYLFSYGLMLFIQKFAEWQKIQRKIGKIVPLARVAGSEEKTADNPEVNKLDSELVKNLADNWFDPRIEFCERFFSTAEDDSPDVISQHEVIKHAAAFLNTAGGYVLIGVGKQGRLEWICVALKR